MGKVGHIKVKFLLTSPGPVSPVYICLCITDWDHLSSTMRNTTTGLWIITLSFILFRADEEC